MSNIIETVEYRGFEIDIFADYDASNWLFDEVIKNHDGHTDYFTTYGRWNGYTLFDVEAEAYAGIDGWLEHVNSTYHVLDESLDDLFDDELDKGRARIEKWIDNNLYVLPIYVYEHGGITMRTGGYGCQWDSGQAGFIYSDKQRACVLAGAKRMSKKVEARIYEVMHGHIEYCAALCEGNVCGYNWEHGGCGGYVTGKREYYDDMINEARANIDHYIESEHKKAIEARKAMIRNRVPLLRREAYAIG